MIAEGREAPLSDREAIGPTARGRRRLRLWHLSVAVLVSALALGAIRALGREPNGLASLALILISSGISLGLIRAFRALAGRAIGRLKGWGLRMGGVLGFGVWSAGVAMDVGFLLASILIGPIATIIVALWLSRLAGP